MDKRTRSPLDGLIEKTQTELASVSADFEKFRVRRDELQLDLEALLRSKKRWEAQGNDPEPPEPKGQGRKKKGAPSTKQARGTVLEQRGLNGSALISEAAPTFIATGSPIGSACLAIFKEEKRPLRLTEVESILRKKEHYTGSLNNVWMALKRLETKKLLINPSRGVYQLVSHT